MKKSSEFSSLKYLKVFIAVLFIAIIITLIYRAFILIIDSKYDNGFFSILIASNNSFVVILDPRNKKISQIELASLDKNKITSPQQASYQLGLPIDAVINYKNKENINPLKDLKSLSKVSSIFSLPFKYSLKGLNQLDIFKIYLASNSISDTHEYKYKNSPNEIIPIYNTQMYESTKNPSVINDNKTIEVINASRIDGAGTKIAMMLKNGGYNIISIKTSRKLEKGKIITRGGENVTTHKLSKIFPMPQEEKTEESVTDITVIIDENYLNKVL